MTATKPRDSQNPGHLFATAKAKRRKAGGPPLGLVAQTAATKVYRCSEPGCRTRVQLGPDEPLPVGWGTVAVAGPSPIYRCAVHSAIPFDDAPPADIGIPSDDDYRRAARRLYETNVIDIPEGAEVRAEGDWTDGKWVACWAFVSDDDASDNNESGAGMNTAAPATHQEN